MKGFYEGKRVLVTGGTGFVGSHFAEQLAELGANVVIPVHKRPSPFNDERIEEIPTADLSDKDTCLSLCEGADIVIHAAGCVGSSGTGALKVMKGISGNLNLTVNILEACWETEVPKALIFSSSTVYPAVDYPVTESSIEDGDVFPGYYGYGWMRRYFEKLAAFVEQASGKTKVNVIRPTATYGQRGDFKPDSSQVVHSLIRRVCGGESPLVVWGKPDVIRDFLHVSDLVRGSLMVLEKHQSPAPVNIGFGKGTTVAELAETILKVAGRNDLKLVFDETKPTALRFRLVDISLAEKTFGFSPRISLEEGLEMTVKWYLENEN